MKFSLLIAHYNNWFFFQDCYQSICQQCIQDFEIIIVDDFSEDGSFEKLDQLSTQDSRISLYRNDENRGVGYTKNRCLNHAKGEILIFIDPDDAIFPNALSEVVKAFEDNPKVSVIYSQMMMCDDALVPQYIFPKTREIQNSDPYFVNIDTAVAHLFAFKKEAFQKIENIDVRLKSAVDQDLYLKLYEVGSFFHIKKPLYKYRMHEKGVSQKKNKLKAKDDFKSVIIKTLARRNVKSINGKLISSLSDDQLYQELIKLENSFFRKIKRKLNL